MNKVGSGNEMGNLAGVGRLCIAQENSERESNDWVVTRIESPRMLLKEVVNSLIGTNRDETDLTRSYGKHTAQALLNAATFLDEAKEL